MNQQVILVNQNDEILGVKEKLIAHKEGLLHRAFSIIIFNDNKELLLQRRALSKYHSAGLWTNTCCSHPSPEENIEESIHKRLSFEMGFDCNLYFGFSFLYKIKFKNGLTENEFDHVYYGFYNDLPQINYNEVMDFRWVSIDALKKEVAESPQNFTAWFPLILEKLLLFSTIKQWQSMKITPGKILAQINSPEDLRKRDRSELTQICDELRQYIIDDVSVFGGHFGASLGVVELSVALHYVFNTPYDQLVWDVGHQAYGHKILTGRRDNFHTNRMYDGISGFPKRKESKYDAFGVGHSSTSISAALGMSVASQYKGEKDRQHIAVIGDGSMTAGMAFEAMNQAGVIPNNMIIILNDNCMAIDPNVGALKEYLTDITTSHTYNRVKDEVWNLMGKISKFGKSAQDIVSKIENGLKATLLKQSNLFESLNLRYFGPIDGHDVEYLATVLNDLKNIPGPKILHCITTKGKGYALAEKDQTLWHAPGKFDKITGIIKKTVHTTPQAPKYQDVFGNTIVELAEQNAKIMGVTPAMPSGSSLNIMMKAMPNRAFDVGIAEQHAVTFSAGMATQGLTVFCNIYSSFMQRAYDQVIHDVAIQELPVIFCLDRAGFAGADGPTHHGAYDIAYMRCIPNMIVFSPINEKELRDIMFTVSQDDFKDLKSCISIRYPRGEGVMPNWKTPFEKIQIGQGRKIKDGENVAILTIGHIGNYAVTACEMLEKEGINPAHYDMRFVKPLDEVTLHEIFQNYDKVITVEDGCIQGGFGSAVGEFMLDNGYSSQLKRLGIPDRVVEQGEQMELHKECGFDPESIAKIIMEMEGVFHSVSVPNSYTFLKN